MPVNVGRIDSEIGLATLTLEEESREILPDWLTTILLVIVNMKMLLLQ